MACTCQSHPVVLRLSLPPGSAPEVVTALVERAVRAYFERQQPWGEVPDKMSPIAYRGRLREIATEGRS